MKMINKNQILITVIIPVYNMDEYLDICLNSVINQSLSELEILCIDDGSTDRSNEIIKLFVSKDSRIRCIRTNNLGAAHARNIGIREAKGEYLAFIDADDYYYDKYALEHLYFANKKYLTKISGGSFGEIDEYGTVKTGSDFDDNRFWGYNFGSEEVIFYEGFQFDFGFHRFIYDRDFIITNKLFFPDLSYFEDPPFLVKTLSLVEKFSVVPNIIYMHRTYRKEKEWKAKSVVDLYKGLLMNLKFAKINGYEKLYQLTLYRLENDYISAIEFYVDTIETIEKLVINNSDIFEDDSQTYNELLLLINPYKGRAANSFSYKIGLALTFAPRVLVKATKKLEKTFRLYLSLLEIRKLSKSIAIEDNKILFLTTEGKYYCNPRAIVDEILKQGLPWEIVWVVKNYDSNNNEQYPIGCKIVLAGSREYYHELSSSKIWIDNSINLICPQIYKKRGQYLIETWHGSFGIKRFETSANKEWIKDGKNFGKATDYILSNSDAEDCIFRHSFWKKTAILKIGHPRNDMLITTDSDRVLENRRIMETIRLQYGLLDKKVALYAPTFRDDVTCLDPYALDYSGLVNALQDRFGGEWVILLRTHFLMKKSLKKILGMIPNSVIDVSDYIDIQDLMLVVDVGVTDYSSWAYDFILTRKPLFIYATDINDYENERGFYFSLESTPFPLAKNNYELIENVRLFDFEKYTNEVNSFLIEKGCIEDGHASEKIVEKLKELMRE